MGVWHGCLWGYGCRPMAIRLLPQIPSDSGFHGNDGGEGAFGKVDPRSGSGMTGVGTHAPPQRAPTSQRPYKWWWISTRSDQQGGFHVSPGPRRFPFSRE